MNKIELAEQFALMWKRSRQDAGKSQEYMAKALCVSKQTVKNWENGTSSPNQIKAFEWFEVLNLQPLPYYLEALYPGRFTKNASDDDICEILFKIIKGLPTDIKKKLLYMFTGNHGSSTIGMIELATAHLHVPLEKRINIAQSVSTNYELSKVKNVLCCPDDIQPNMETLNRSIRLGLLAVMEGYEGYTDIIKEIED